MRPALVCLQGARFGLKTKRVSARKRLDSDANNKNARGRKIIVAPRRAATAIRANPNADIRDSSSRPPSTNNENNSASRRKEYILRQSSAEFITPVQPESQETLPESFTSPPLSPGLLEGVYSLLSTKARPTPIQALSLKHMFKVPAVTSQKDYRYKQHLLAAETGSGKTVAYLLPLLHHLKASELSRPDSDPEIGEKGDRRAENNLPRPRALLIAPTHELVRQLARVAKSLLHGQGAKLRVLCTSTPNIPNVDKSKNGPQRGSSMSARKMKNLFMTPDSQEDEALQDPSDGLSLVSEDARNRPVDLLVTTPMKALEMLRGHNWDRDDEDDQDNMVYGRSREPKRYNSGQTQVFKPELNAKDIEWVVIDEADVLFDPDFKLYTQFLLSDISQARGYDPPQLSSVQTNAKSAPQPISKPQPHLYPFHLTLTSATIPRALSTYLDTYHPSLQTLASPKLHQLPSNLKTEYVYWSPHSSGSFHTQADGNENHTLYSAVEAKLRSVLSLTSSQSPRSSTTRSSQRSDNNKVLIFANKNTTVLALAVYLSSHDIPSIPLTSRSPARTHGSNRHLSSFLHPSASAKSSSTPDGFEPSNAKSNPRVLITTSLLSRGLDFSPSVDHVFILDQPRNMIDFLHRAGRTARAGRRGRVIVFEKEKKGHQKMGSRNAYMRH